MQDEKIVELYFLRDESAITYTQEKYDKYLYKIAYNVLANIEDSKESVNDTYLAAWNSIPPHRPQVLSTYLGKLTRRISIDIFRKRNRVKRQGSEYAISLTELSECLADNKTPETDLEIKALGEAINAYLSTISIEARNIFIGRYYFLDSVKDIARYCGISESKAKTSLHRTRKGLGEYLKKEGFIV